ncbi:MAG: TerC/Alx family metal homeostasis membrane protein [Propionibacteriaceae bacterium]|jgi:tellurite resistance protein TerC|nr:TerC/Alx family metal homeostasis membrane protein [Propionibacteriaceae bacterium]
MGINTATWAISIAAVVAVIGLDFVLHVRRPHVPGLVESATWIGVYVTAALGFGLGLGLVVDWGLAGQFFAGYVTEESLSLDNLFIFLLIITKFRVPKEAEQKVLLVGISIALVLRLVFILLGAAVIERFAAVFYLFGGFLLYTAVKLMLEQFQEAPDERAETYTESRLIRLLRRWLPTTPGFVGDRVVARHEGKRAFTPLLMVMVAIGSTDILFAMDSIPAIFGLTKEPYIVFMANACALLGLRQLYFLIGGLIDRLAYLPQGLSVILAFIGFKLILEALAANDLPFINSGRPVHLLEIPTTASLGFIVATLVVVVVLSRLKTRRQAGPDPAPPSSPQSPAEG